MSGSPERARQFYVAHLRSERRRQRSAFEAKFGIGSADYRWVDPEVNLDYFEPNTYAAARPRVLPLPLREISHSDWSSLRALTACMWEGRDTVRLLFDSLRSIGAIELDAQRLPGLFDGLLSADADAVVAATPDWTAWALFDVHSLRSAAFRVDVVLRGEWASMGGTSHRATP